MANKHETKTQDPQAPAAVIPSESPDSTPEGTSGEGPASVAVSWDDSTLRTVYANAANVATSREEIVLLFGTLLGWTHGEGERTIKLSERVILTPFTAKRFLTALGRIVSEYETRFGPIDISAPQRATQG